MTESLTRRQREGLGNLLVRACRGESRYAWLHRLVLAAGYAKIAGRGSGDLVLVTAKSLASGFGVSERTVRSWLHEGLPVFRESHGNTPALFDVFAVIRWHGEQERAKREMEMEDSDPLLAGGGKGSPALEAYRLEKAREARRNNEVAEGRLVDAEAVRTRLAEIGLVFRNHAEAIRRRHGKKAGLAIEKMVDEAEEAWKKSLPERTEPEEPAPEVSPEAESRPRASRASQRRAASQSSTARGKKKPAKPKPRRKPPEKPAPEPEPPAEATPAPEETPELSKPRASARGKRTSRRRPRGGGGIRTRY